MERVKLVVENYPFLKRGIEAALCLKVINKMKLLENKYFRKYKHLSKSFEMVKKIRFHFSFSRMIAGERWHVAFMTFIKHKARDTLFERARCGVSCLNHPPQWRLSNISAINQRKLCPATDKTGNKPLINILPPLMGLASVFLPPVVAELSKAQAY